MRAIFPSSGSFAGLSISTTSPSVVVDAIQHARRGRDEVHVELALETLLDDLHVEQSEEPAAKAEAERDRRFGLEEERRVVETKLLERLAQLLIPMSLDRIQSGEDHRLERLEARIWLGRRTVGLGDRVTNLRIADDLDSTGEEADFARAQFVHQHRLRREDPDLIDLVILRRRHQSNLHVRLDHAVDHPNDDDDAAVRVVPGIEDERFERGIGIAVSAGAADGPPPRGSP